MWACLCDFKVAINLFLGFTQQLLFILKELTPLS